MLAGAGGIEPTLTVLETVVLPLYDAPVVSFVAGRVPKRAEMGKSRLGRTVVRYSVYETFRFPRCGDDCAGWPYGRWVRFDAPTANTTGAD